MSRIFVIFDDEEPKNFARRFKKAYQNRIHADALIKYNYYIENMPKHQIPEVDNYQVNRILAMTQNTKTLRGKSSADTTTLLNEVNVDFAKTMNNIIFDKHLYEKGNDLITGPLHLPARVEKGLAPYFGMIRIPQHSFAKKISKFSFRTLQIKDEVIRAQQEIRKECNDVAVKDIYNPNVTKTMKVDDFKQIQASSISQTSYYLKETWVNKIKEIIKANFSESNGGDDRYGASWFNLQETNKEAYEFGKLKKFLMQCKFVMQDTILTMTRKSVSRYVDSVIWFLPRATVIKSAHDVKNTYWSNEQIKALGAAKDKFPLFQIDIELTDNNEAVYSHQPDDIVTTILKTYDNGLLALQEITQLEQKLLPHLFKSNQKMYLKVPIKPMWMPEAPDPENKKLLPDENTWVYEEYQRLKDKIAEVIDPLNTYIETFAVFKDEYKLDPAALIAELDDPDNPPDVMQLQKDVFFHRKEVERLKAEIPETAVVSMFLVNCRKIRD